MRWYYEKQGIPCCKQIVPILGNMLRVDKIFKTYNSNESPWIIMMQEDFGQVAPRMIQWFTGFEPTLVISDPDVI